MYLLSVCLQNTDYFIDPITENDGVNLHIKAHKSNSKQTTILTDLREREREYFITQGKREREREIINNDIHIFCLMNS